MIVLGISGIPHSFVASRKPSRIGQINSEWPVIFEAFIQFVFQTPMARTTFVCRITRRWAYRRHPDFCGMDSSDVWSMQHLFELDQNGNPTVVAGVPPTTLLC